MSFPCNNKRDSIDRAIQSVTRQTLTDFELVIVDDGSTDESPQVVLAFKDPRVRLIRQENGGVSSARNAGIHAAQGQWVALLDADDFWYSGHLAALSEAIESNPSSIMVGSGMLSVHRGGLAITTRVDSGTPITLPSFFACQMDTAVVNSSSVALHRETAIQAGLFPLGIGMGEDQDTWCRMAWNGGVTLSPKVTSVYDRRWEMGAMWDSARGSPRALHPILTGYPGNRRNGHPLCPSFDALAASLLWNEIVASLRRGDRQTSKWLMAHELWEPAKRNHPIAGHWIEGAVSWIPMGALRPMVHLLSSRLFLAKKKCRNGVILQKTNWTRFPHGWEQSGEPFSGHP